MKNKYQRLSKEDKKECRKMYYSTVKGREMHLRLIRIVCFGIIGILFDIYLIGTSIINHEIHWYDYLVIIPLFLASIVFLIGAYLLRKKVLNQFTLKIPRFKNK